MGFNVDDHVMVNFRDVEEWTGPGVITEVRTNGICLVKMDNPKQPWYSIGGFPEECLTLLPPQEKLFLVCDECGEAFDTIETAAAHDNDEHGTGFTIKPESEAM